MNEFPDGSCLELWAFDGAVTYAKRELKELFPEVSESELGDFGAFAAVVCLPEGKATAAAIPSTGAGGSTSRLRSSMMKACKEHPGSSLSQRPGFGTSASVPGLPGLPLSSPDTDDVRCASAVPNPYAQSDDRTTNIVDSYNRPANKAKEELVKEVAGVMGGFTVLGVLLGGKPDKGLGLGAIVKAGELIINSEKAAGKVGEYMWQEAIFVSDLAATNAENDADLAEAAALEAQAIASGTNNPEVQKLAAEAAAAAKAARAAAEQAKVAAEATKKEFKNAGQSAQIAKKAAAEAADKRAEAERKKQEAEDKSKNETPAPQPDSDRKDPQSRPGSTGDIKDCDSLRMFIWECEQSGWKSFACQEFLWNLHRCGGDITVIYPTDDGFKCAGAEPDVPAEVVVNVAKRVCEQVIKPAPGEDPCGQPVVTGGLKEPWGPGCDPTVAEDGCPSVQPQVVLEIRQYCPPQPPDFPPLPCFSKEGPPVPVPQALDKVLAHEGPGFLIATEGIGTAFSRDAQFLADSGGGFSAAFIFHGLRPSDL